MTDQTSAPVAKRNWLVFLSIQFATCCAALETTAITVAVPAIAEEFGISASSAIWVLGAPQILVVAVLLPLSALGDALGARSVYLTSLVGFVVTTLCCALAPNFEFLVAARLAQSACVAGIMSVNFSLVRTQFTDAELGRAVGMLAATVATASAAGPAVSGFLLTLAGWRWIFFAMLPIGIIAVSLGYRLLPHLPGSGNKLHSSDMALVACALGCLVASIYGFSYQWPVAITLALMAIGACAAVFLYRASRHQEAPAFPVDLLRNPILALSFSASVSAFTVQALSFVALPFLLLFQFNLTELQMALVLTTWPVTIALIAPRIGRIAHRLPAGIVGAIGLAVLALGLILIAMAPDDASPIELGWRMIVCGLGFGFFQTPNNRLIMFVSPKERSGAASGMLALSRQIGRALGTAIAAATLTLGDATDARIALIVGAVVALISASFSLARSRASQT